ncbi:MAG: ABC transporter substrate-binding protein [Sphaerobacter sp.]|nr:ABC transporter substrate-binding protein [Sphaerobacter sp.]
MATPREFNGIIYDLLTGRVSRREFIKRAGALGLSATSIAAILAACGGGEEEATSTGSSGGSSRGTGATPSASPAASGGSGATGSGGTLDRVVVALGADARTLMPNTIVDATTTWQLENIFDPVLRRDPDNNFKVGPWLGELTSIDDLTWEIKIVKEGIKFHNGEPFDAEAIKVSLEYALDPANKSHYLERWKPITEITVVDPMTVRLKTSEPYPIMPTRLAELYPIPPKYLAEKGIEYVSQNPVGTGPFKFKEWVRDEHLLLEQNPDYWRGPVAVKELEFRYIPEFASRLSALLAGEVDIIKDVPVDAIERVNSSGVARAIEIPSSRINYVALVNNREGSIMADKRVRQAINYGVNVDAIIEGVFQGHATRMAGALSKINPEVDPSIEPYPYDPEKAKQLLEEAGIQPGTQIVLDSPQGRYPMDTDAAQAIAAELEQLGFRVQVQYNEWGTHLDKIVNRRTGDAFYLGWGPALDAEGTLRYLFVGDSTYSGYTNPEVEKLIAEASKTVNPERRQELWNQVQRAVWEDAGWLFLWQQHDIYGVSNKVEWTPRVDESLFLGTVKPRQASGPKTGPKHG